MIKFKPHNWVHLNFKKNEKSTTINPFLKQTSTILTIKCNMSSLEPPSTTHLGYISFDKSIVMAIDSNTIHMIPNISIIT